MGALRPDQVPVRDPAAELVQLSDGRLLVRHRGGLSLLSGPSRSEVEELLALVDGERTVAAIAERSGDGERALGLLGALWGEAVRPVAAAEPEAEAGRSVPRVAVLVSGSGGADLAGGLSATGAWEIQGVELPPGEGEASGAGDPAAVTGADLVVAALEDSPYRRLLGLQGLCLDHGVPVLFVTADPDGVRVGPAVLPGGATACLACSLLAALSPARLPVEECLDAAGRLTAGELPPARVAPLVGREVAALLGGSGAPVEPRCLDAVLLIAGGGAVRRLAVAPHEDCPVCAPRGGEPPPEGRVAELVRRAERHRVLRTEREAPRRRPAAGTGPGLRVGVLGGGTAGSLAALAFRAKRPGDRVTLLRSRDVPVIGVGEATTPLMPQFLHADLRVGAAELFREVRPTFKLGIRFDWGEPGPGGGGFPYPFGPVRSLEAAAWDGHLRAASLQAALMAAGALPVEASGDGRLEAHFGTEVAYHLDNRRLAAFLEDLAAARRVELVEARIARVERREGGGGEPEVAALVAEDGRRFEFDLYLDCSGFRSLLLGDALGSPFVSYEGSLFTDRAVVGEAAFAGSGAGGARLAPETAARTMDAGWCWSIPQEDADHVGYVFSSRFLDAAGAASELRRLRPGMSEERLREIRFRSGRRQHFWRGNVVALGNAYGFVEPLESTALHLLIRQIGLLVRALPAEAAAFAGRAGALRPLLDRRVGAFWDYVAWFLALHFRFNRRLDAPFWRACREEADVSTHGELLELYRERGPLAYNPGARDLFDYPDPLWGAEGIDTVLLGQGVPCRLPEPALPAAAWHRQTALYRKVAERSLPQEEVLRRLPDHPEVLESLEAAFRSHGPAF